MKLVDLGNGTVNADNITFLEPYSAEDAIPVKTRVHFSSANQEHGFSRDPMIIESSVKDIADKINAPTKWDKQPHLLLAGDIAFNPEKVTYFEEIAGSSEDKPKTRIHFTGPQLDTVYREDVLVLPVSKEDLREQIEFFMRVGGYIDKLRNERNA